MNIHYKRNTRKISICVCYRMTWNTLYTLRINKVILTKQLLQYIYLNPRIYRNEIFDHLSDIFYSKGDVPILMHYIYITKTT